MMRRWLRRIAFLCCLTVCVSMANSVLKRTNDHGARHLKDFYRLEQGSIDVLFLGSSHMDSSINPAILWEGEGIPACMLTGPLQFPWEAYHALVEGLKYQTPKLIVMEVFGTTSPETYNYDAWAWLNVFGYRPSVNWVHAVQAGVRPELRTDTLLGMPVYHSRYAELTREDFGLRDYVYMNGYVPNYQHVPMDAPTLPAAPEPAEMTPKAKEYLLRIIELAKQRGIPLLLWGAPYAPEDRERAIYHEVAEIAAAHGCAFLDYNLDYDAIGLDFSTDMHDREHLNTEGSAKITRVFGRYLRERHGEMLPDRREDPRYASWDAWATETAAYIARQGAY